MSEVDLHYAASWRRLAAFAVDIVLMLLPVTVLGAIVLLFVLFTQKRQRGFDIKARTVVRAEI